MRIAILGVAVACVLANASGSDAAVLAWRSGGTLHLSNDPSAEPSERAVRRFEARRPSYSGPAAREPTTRSHETPPVPRSVQRRQQVSCPHATAPFSSRPLIISPTIVLGQSAPTVIVVDEEAPDSFDYGFLPSGFIGHEHPQVPFLAGRRLIEHSHFFARGRAGRFTPWGHFSSNGLLHVSTPAY